MDAFHGVPWDLVGGLASLGALFLLREFASGALRQAGEDAWARSRWGRGATKARPPRCRRKPGLRPASETRAAVPLLGSTASTPSIRECLVGVPFPVAKDDLLERLAMNGATEVLLAPIRASHVSRFTAPEEVIKAIRGG